MKNFKILILSAILAMFCGCVKDNIKPQNEAIFPKSLPNKQAEILNFKSQNAQNPFILKLSSNDNFQTATLMSSFGKIYHLKRVASGSRILLKDNLGTEIHFKDKAGIVVLEKSGDLPIELKD